MKTKFLQLLKVKEQKLKDIELELYHVQNKKSQILQELDNIVHDISNLTIPKSGSFAKINILYANKKTLLKQKELKKQMVKLLEEKIKQIQTMYKRANIEFEKIKYLHDLEIKKILQNIKEQEQKDMDEIANLLFVNKKIGEKL